MIKYPLNVTIDTNIFESNKFDFSSNSTMNILMKNIQNGKIHLVLSNIVINEVEKHICHRVDEVCGKARKLRKEYLDILPEQFLVDIEMGVYVQIPNKDILYQRGKDVFYKFLRDCKVERLDTKCINLEEILGDYFAVRPPFENSEKKRKEFPDAFIAEEIKKRFGNDEVVAIISQDKGFKKACSNSKNHLFFSSLGELFDTLNKNELEYTNAINFIKSKNDVIMKEIKSLIDDDCVEVNGLAYDKDGVSEGYEYDETYIKKCYLMGMKIHSIDDIDGNIIIASLWIHGNISVDCYFDDYSNSPWDSEEKEYVYVEERHFLEKHDSKFACRIEVNSVTEEMRVLPFRIELGGDSIKSRVEIDDEKESLYREIEDSEREDFGFLPLSGYGEMMAEKIIDSSMYKNIVELFEQYNDISSFYEELANLYDDICGFVNDEIESCDVKICISELASNKGIPVDFSKNDDQELMEDIKEWLNNKYDVVARRMERNLPDYIEYGDNITIVGTSDIIYTLSFGELYGTPEAGSEEQIDISLTSNQETLARGHVKLTVGYLEFDEDGGAAEGIEDSIIYEVDDVLSELEKLISEVKKEFSEEKSLAESLYNRMIKKR